MSKRRDGSGASEAREASGGREESGDREASSGVLLTAIRIWLPIAIAIAGIVAIVIGHARTPVAGAGVVLLGAGLIVWMINWLFRISVESNRDRDREEEAREYFDRHGRWEEDP